MCWGKGVTGDGYVFYRECSRVSILGATTTRRTFLISGDYGTPGDLETAALDFIRSARVANEEELQNHGGPVGERES